MIMMTMIMIIFPSVSEEICDLCKTSVRNLENILETNSTEVHCAALIVRFYKSFDFRQDFAISAKAFAHMSFVVKFQDEIKKALQESCDHLPSLPKMEVCSCYFLIIFLFLNIVSFNSSFIIIF